MNYSSKKIIRGIKDMTNLPSLFNKQSFIDRFFGNDKFFSDFFDIGGDFERIFSDKSYCCKTSADGDVVLELEVPGYNADNLKVELSDGVLSIKGERDENNKFARRWTVGNIEDIEASVKDGILTVTLKQLEQAKEAKRIDVQDG